MVVPQLHIVGEVEQCIGDAVVFRLSVDAEIALIVIKPRQRVFNTIVFGKLHLVGAQKGFIIFIVITHAMVTIPQWLTTTSGPLLMLIAEETG
jgi:hypothetical protein